MKKDSVLDRLDAFLSRVSPDELYNMLVDEYHMPTIDEEEDFQVVVSGNYILDNSNIHFFNHSYTYYKDDAKKVQCSNNTVLITNSDLSTSVSVEDTGTALAA